MSYTMKTNCGIVTCVEKELAFEKLYEYEQTRLEPHEVKRLLRDAEKYKGAGLAYEKEIDELNKQLRKVQQERDGLAVSMSMMEAEHKAEIERLKEKQVITVMPKGEAVNIMKMLMERTDEHRLEYVEKLRRDIQKLEAEKPKHSPWLEAMLFSSSCIIAGFSWWRLDAWPLMAIYWMMLAGYWTAALWRRWKS